jgi:nitrite reductase/ring-hydroxylating ferredoxin subunit
MDNSSNSTPPPGLDEKLQKAVDKALYAGGRPAAQTVRNFLNGTWLGEPLHVVLKDVPAGAWTVAIIFDVLDVALDRPEFAVAADASVAIGIAGAAAAALAGVTDYASHLGGKMVYEHRVGVDRTDGQAFPNNFDAVLPESTLVEGMPTRAIYQGVPILLVRRGERIFALADTCSHFGGPLSKGKLVGDSIVCPYHSSRFALQDGRVLDGPAVHSQPCLEVRIRDGQIEVRKASAPDMPSV